MMKEKDIDAIVIHCSATKEGKDYTVKDIEKWHKERGFKEIGYHFVIYRDGSVHAGRELPKDGAHANTPGVSGKSYNLHSIGICYIGGLDKDGKNPKDTRTDEQKKALMELVDYLMNRYPNIKEVIGHRDTSPDIDGDGEVEPNEWIKDCPCFEVKEEFPMAVCTAKI